MNKYTEQRPWGKFERFTANEQCTVKLLTIEPGESLSLQHHKHRDEFWHILQGSPTLTIGDQTIAAKPGDEFFVEKNTNHCIAANEEQVKVLEIATGDYSEEDIVRLKDKYNRA